MRRRKVFLFSVERPVLFREFLTKEIFVPLTRLAIAEEKRLFFFNGKN